MPRTHPTSPGSPAPLGARCREGGVNFAVFSQHATRVELLLFDGADDARPRQTVTLRPTSHRTDHIWHVFVAGIGAGQLYGYRVFGPPEPARGHRFDPHKLLLDPYARAVARGSTYDRAAACQVGHTDHAASMKAVVAAEGAFDWQGVTPPRHDPACRVIYELHVRGFTRHPSSCVDQPGTFAGLIAKIPHLKRLGVTTVQLMPVFQFDPDEVTFTDPVTGAPLTNYWGYSPLSFFAPHPPFAGEEATPQGAIDAFKRLVRELHRAGLEVLLDVVFNHTAEGDPRGPTLSLRGLDNTVYYLLDPDDPSRYADFSGCGNTLNANHPVVRRLILDSLRYWVREMRVDGFRFDLASALARGQDGVPLDAPPLLWAIETDPALLHTKLIAEAWDAGGLYQVGAFPGDRWAEWNGPFRDDMRRFLRGEHGVAGAVAARLTGSADLYETSGRLPAQSINYVTCHDGMTLTDLVSYAAKHNHANGEENRDGHTPTLSDNHGIEGPTHEPAILRARDQHRRSLIAMLFIAHGTPMLLMGDAQNRTQRGNNNAYCQDNVISWLDWERGGEDADFTDFVRRMIALRAAHPLLHPTDFAVGPQSPLAGRGGRPVVRWHGTRTGRPDWSATSRTIAYTLSAPGQRALHIIANAHDAAMSFALPPVPDGGAGPWRLAVDTALSARDAVRGASGPPVGPSHRDVSARSVVVLIASAPGAECPG